MVAEGDGRIVRDFKRRTNRRTIIKIGEVRVEIVPCATKDSHGGWKVVMPAGGRIEHIDLTQTTPEK